MFLAKFAFERQLVQHVGKGFRVHQTVLEGNMESIAVAEQRQGRISKGDFFERGVERFADPLVVTAYLLNGGPVRGLVVGQAAAHGIDSKSEESVEFLLKRVDLENIPAQQVPVKGLQVSEVKEKAVALGDGPLIDAVRTHDAEQFVSEGAGFSKRCGNRAITFRQGLLRRHVHLPVLARIKLCRSPELSEYGMPRVGVNGESRVKSRKLRVRLLLILTFDSRLSTSVRQAVSTHMTQENNVAIEFRGVSYRLETGPFLLEDLNLQVQRAETLVLLGRSGSGKTTTLKLINGLLKPTQGQVLVEGRATSDADPLRLRRRIGYVIQEVGLFPNLTVERNVGLVPRLENWSAERTRARVQEMLTLVGLEPGHFAARYPRQLSGGQRQRVGVARALAADPPLLLMDEPFGALDPLTRAEIQQEFQQLQQRLQKTVVFVTHDLREALMLASRVALLEGGKLAGVYTPQEFRSAPNPIAGAYREAFESPRRRD